MTNSKPINMQYKTKLPFLLWASIVLVTSCSQQNIKEIERNKQIKDSIQAAQLEQHRLDSIETVRKKFLPENIILEKELLYDKYTLEDVYPYKDTTREFQWEKIRVYLALIDSMQSQSSQWGILKNRKNIHGAAPLTEHISKNAYGNMEDTFGVERYQGIPFYFLHDTTIPKRYGLDGSLVKITSCRDSSSSFITIWHAASKKEWKVPHKYVKYTSDTTFFQKIAFIDRHNQNITTVEKKNDKWLIRSMNPATTGVHRPPYMQETPLGIFVVQEKKVTMIFLQDGSSEKGGFAPYASRFCNGGYIHGLPVNVPRKALIEYSSTLGTFPRSHMCVRNSTSHAKFVYDWAPVQGTLVFVIE